MKCQPWMNHYPVPTKTPLQIAEADVRHWSARIRSLTAELTECEKQFSDALTRRDRLEREQQK